MQQLIEKARSGGLDVSRFETKIECYADWQTWAKKHFPAACTAPFGVRHVRLWDWFDSLLPGVRPAPRVEVWPRGGAKSATGELGCVRVGAKLTRRFCLYVSETQEQADKHVQSISTLFEQLGVERALSKYGTSKGWRRDQLRTANGFNVAAIGLDVAARGIKLDTFRPDLIIFDDIDNQIDTPKTTEKKIAALTTAIIPAGSGDCAVLFLQNLIMEDGIVAQLVDNRADFLHDREPAFVEPAVRGLKVESVLNTEGGKTYHITAGVPTWDGQDLARCEEQINAFGLAAFLREAQHEVRNADGYFFDVSQLNYIDAHEVPAGLRYCRAWDLAATQGGGDFTAGVKSGIALNGNLYIVDLIHGQWSSDNVTREIEKAAKADGPACILRLPQDPAQAGKYQKTQMQQTFAPYSPKFVLPSGDKATRAKGLQGAVNKGVVYVVRAAWNPAFREELRKFKEDGTQAHDDCVDGASDTYNELAPRPGMSLGGGDRPNYISPVQQRQQQPQMQAVPAANRFDPYNGRR